MFTFTEARLHHSSDAHVKYSVSSDRAELSILKTFEFESELQRMSVIVRRENSKEIAAFVKGAPEMIRKLLGKSQVVQNYDEQLQRLTLQGLRVLALAYRPHSKQLQEDYSNLTRDQIESDLQFLGFLAFQNSLKPDSREVILNLINNGIDCKVEREKI